MDKENISELIWLYVKRRPFLKESLREQIINYSSIARRISYEFYGNNSKFNAIKMALQRISKKLLMQEENLEEKVLQVLKSSSLNIQTKIAVVISRGELPLTPISYSKSREYTTYIINENQILKLKKDKRVKSIKQNLNLITIVSSDEIENTPGVVSLIMSVLASEGINVQEIISCYTDTLIVVKEADSSKSYEILSSLLQ
ncbi:MAG: ACT domain-containing protein [Candidatus ainarchaeum sp.]|nr:ACT domain-containing protein [Candidatus ainarchaeum sp.]